MRWWRGQSVSKDRKTIKLKKIPNSPCAQNCKKSDSKIWHIIKFWQCLIRTSTMWKLVNDQQSRCERACCQRVINEYTERAASKVANAIPWFVKLGLNRWPHRACTRTNLETLPVALQHNQKDVHCELPVDKTQKSTILKLPQAQTILLMQGLLSSKKSLVQVPSKTTSAATMMPDPTALLHLQLVSLSTVSK